MKLVNGQMEGATILVYDYGTFLSHALNLANNGKNRVLYYTPWMSSYSEFYRYAPGIGFEDQGLQKVYYFEPFIKESDLLFFPDVGPGSLSQYLRKTTTKPIFGTADDYEGGDRFEQDRWFMRQMQNKLGLPTQETKRVTGMTNLRKYLKEHDNVFVKLNKFRGDTESFAAKSYSLIEIHLDEVEVALGPFSESYKFMIEPFIDGVEPGFDCFFNGKDWVKPYLWGIELGKTNYIGKFVNELPKPLQLIADKLKPMLQSINYRGALSIEARVTKEGKPYLIDTCSRFPAPLATGYQLAIENYGEVIWKVANGENVTVKNKSTYFAASPLSTPHAKDHFVRLDFPEKESKNIKVYTAAKVDGNYYAIKGETIVFVIVDAGEDYNKLIVHIRELSEKVDAYMLDRGVVSEMEKITEIVKDYPSYGMGKF